MLRQQHLATYINTGATLVASSSLLYEAAHSRLGTSFLVWQAAIFLRTYPRRVAANELDEHTGLSSCFETAVPLAAHTSTGAVLMATASFSTESSIPNPSRTSLLSEQPAFTPELASLTKCSGCTGRERKVVLIRYDSGILCGPHQDRVLKPPKWS